MPQQFLVDVLQVGGYEITKSVIFIYLFIYLLIFLNHSNETFHCLHTLLSFGLFLSSSLKQLLAVE